VREKEMTSRRQVKNNFGKDFIAIDLGADRYYSKGTLRSLGKTKPEKKDFNVLGRKTRSTSPFQSFENLR